MIVAQPVTTKTSTPRPRPSERMFHPFLTTSFSREVQPLAGLPRAGRHGRDDRGLSLPADTGERIARTDDDKRSPVVRVLAPPAHRVGRLAHRFDAALASQQVLV